MKILFVTNLPSPYRVEFFDELSKYCTLTVCYERGSSSERDSKWKSEKHGSYTEIFCDMKPVGVDRTIGTDLLKQVKKIEYDFIIITGYASPSVEILIAYLKLKRKPYFIESDGGFFKKDSFVSGIIKRFFLKKAKGFFTTCDELVKYYKSIGCKGEIYKYPFSSLRKGDIFENPSDGKEKSELRNELEIKEEYVVVSVGRFSYQNGYGKGYDAVLRAAKRLENENIGWYIIGGKPTDEFVKLTEQTGLSNIHYIDFKKKDELRKYYRAADISVLMTVSDIWGLVINESMACGLPVITTDRCIAGIEMIEDGKNGYIVSVGDDETLAQKVKYLISNSELLRKMSRENLIKSAGWTIEKMAEKHIKVLSEI